MTEIEKLNNTLKSGETTRYHTTPRVGLQTVAAHAWGVAIIAAYIGIAKNWWEIMTALLHDAPELFLGDMPAPIKEYFESIHEGLFKRLEKTYAEQKFLFPELITRDIAIVALADRLECLHWTFESETKDARKMNRRKQDDIRRVLEAYKDEFTLEQIEKINSMLEAWSVESEK